METEAKTILTAKHAVSVTVDSSGGRRKRVVQFDLQLEEGKIYTLQGPNKSGKSALIKTLMGVLRLPKRENIDLILDQKQIWLRSRLLILHQTHHARFMR